MILLVIVSVLALAGVMAPILVISNRQKLKEMNDLIFEFQLLSPTNKSSERDRYKAQLARIKSGIWSGDKKAVEAARDKLSLI